MAHLSTLWSHRSERPGSISREGRVCDHSGRLTCAYLNGLDFVTTVGDIVPKLVIEGAAAEIRGEAEVRLTLSEDSFGSLRALGGAQPRG